MVFESNYLDLTSKAWLKQGWTKRDLYYVVEKLEGASQEELFRFCELPEIRLKFTRRNFKEEIPKEEIILALLADYKPLVLKSTAKRFFGNG